MRRSQGTQIAASLLVSLAVGAVIKKMLGPKAGIAGAVVAFIAHDAFDAPVAAFLDRLVVGA